MSDEVTPPKTCCQMRRKVVLLLGPVLPQNVCGVPDSELADFLRFDITGPQNQNGQSMPVLATRFCPWCGTRRNDNDETRVTAITGGERDPTEDWKNG